MDLLEITLKGSIITLRAYHGHLPGFRKRHSIWVNEVSPILGCSIEISRDIYTYIYVSMSIVGQKIYINIDLIYIYCV